MKKDDIYEEIKNHFALDNQVVVNKGSGAQGIKYNKKMFIMFYKGDLVIKLSPERVQQLIKSGDGQPFDPGTGKPMKDRLLILKSKKNLWIALSEESKEYVMK
ncbi:MAG: hypothetical protein GY870_05720 [archaeon]|nr:hypothetical protein [archaeon]